MSTHTSIALELRIEAERNARLDDACVHLLRKSADGIENLQNDYSALLRSQRLYGNGPEQLKKSIDANHEKAAKLDAAKTALKGLMDLLSEVDDIAYNEKMSAYELSYWLKKQIKPIMAAEEVLK